MLKEFGQDLKNLRESHNITIAEISAQTRINPKFINLMESGVFNFQPETYIRAFLKEYARCVDVNENILLTDYEKAKSGFYPRKTSGSQKQEDKPLSIKPVIEQTGSAAGASPVTSEKTPPKQSAPGRDWPPPEIRRSGTDEDSKEFSNKTLTQKILLGLLIVFIIAGIIYLIDYLSSSGKDNSSNVKPKSFSEISEDYENKIKGKTNKETITAEDSLKNVKIDSLKLMVVAAKDVRIKVYVDEKRIVEDIIPAKDTMIIAGKDQFRFSSSANTSIDLFLNGKLLKKPSFLTGSTTIKNLVINKDGIVSE